MYPIWHRQNILKSGSQRPLWRLARLADLSSKLNVVEKGPGDPGVTNN
jgi:hypothetical protein